MSISESLFSLAKNNNGKFKSDKQSKFVLSKALDNVIVGGGGSLYGNAYQFFFYCDDDGVVSIEKEMKSGTVVYWERKSESEFLSGQALKIERVELATYINKAREMINRLRADSMTKFMTRLNGVTDPIELGKISSLFEKQEDARLKRIEKVISAKQENFDKMLEKR